MASSLSSLNALLLNPYAATTLQGLQQRVPADVSFKPGATVTARYAVDEEGALALRDVSITDTVDAEGHPQAGNQQQARLYDQQQSTLAGLARPRAAMQPSDEVQLFAATASGQEGVQSNAHNDTLPEGITYIPPQSQQGQPATSQLTTAAQKQVQVATLYAQNADAIYNDTPIFSEAA